MRILAVIGALAIIFGLGAALFFFGGCYSVAATVEDPAVVHWALTNVRPASIERHATDQPPASININDPATVQAGAHAYAARGCTNCHGGPGVHLGEVLGRAAARPARPQGRRHALSAAQLFWVIKNGINMTGMPSFAQAGVRTTRSGRSWRSSQSYPASRTPTTRRGRPSWQRPRRLHRANSSSPCPITRDHDPQPRSARARGFAGATAVATPPAIPARTAQ